MINACYPSFLHRQCFPNLQLHLQLKTDSSSYYIHSKPLYANRLTNTILTVKVDMPQNTFKTVINTISMLQSMLDCSSVLQLCLCRVIYKSDDWLILRGIKQVLSLIWSKMYIHDSFSAMFLAYNL